jgi:hypothetical protein
VEEVLKTQSLYIKTRQIQAILNKYFFKKLQDKLNSSSKFGPVIDPTAGRLKNWEHWHQDIVPHRTLRNNGYLFKLFFYLILICYLILLLK